MSKEKEIMGAMFFSNLKIKKGLYWAVWLVREQRLAT
jgi:hypothetical protein